MLTIFVALFLLIATIVLCAAILLWGISAISNKPSKAALKGDDE